MNKWYQPFGLLLVAAMVGDLSGCAQTNWLAKKPAKKTSDEKLASTDKKTRDKSKRDKLSKDLADARSAKSKDDKDVKTAKASPSKAVDAEHEKYAAAGRPKKKNTNKAPAEAIVAKNDQESAADAKPARPARPVKPKPKTDDDLDSFLAQNDAPVDTPKNSTARKSPAVDLDRMDDDGIATKSKVVPVKNEAGKGEDDELADWATVKTQSDAAPVKSANVGESFEDELQSPLVAKSKSKSREPKSAWPDESSDDSAATTRLAFPTNDDVPVAKKSSSKKDTGLQSLCPDADGELRDLLKGMDPEDPESLKQGVHRIGQMRANGAAAAPLLRKMLKHEDAFVRVHSALAMARLEITSPESITVVTESLKSRNASLRSFGNAVLGEMGPQANDVLTALAESLNDRDGQNRLCAAEVLIRHEDWVRPALQSLLACLKDKDENVRWLTTYSLAELAPESPEVVQALLKATNDPVPKVRVGAVYALGEIGPYAKRASEELSRLRDSSRDDELKSAINHALQQMSKEAH